VMIHSMQNPDGTASATMRTYKITSTAVSGLGSNTQTGTASFSSKATVQDITNASSPISVDGGATMQINLLDGALGKGTNPGIGDLISIYVLNKSGGVWFANKLDSSLKAVAVPVITV